jgi:transcriptional regulator, deoR family
MKNLERLDEKFEDSFEDVVLEKELTYENTIKLTVKFDRKVAFRVYDELSGDIRTDAEGNLYTEIEIPNDHRLYSYILSFGDAVEVLDPPEIRVKMKEMLSRLAEKY